MSTLHGKHHPLQRLSSPSRGLSAALHLAGLISFSLSFRYLLTTPNPINDAYGWHLQFLTIIGLALSTLTFATALLADLTLHPSLFTLKNTLSLTSAPLEILISLLYWSLRAIDPSLVLPAIAPKIAPVADIGFHIIPSLALLLDLLLFSPPWTITTRKAMGISSGIAVAYWIWVERCFSRNGYYPYPIFEEAGRYGRMGLFVGSAVVMAGGTMGLRRVYAVVNGREMGRKRE